MAFRRSTAIPDAPAQTVLVPVQQQSTGSTARNRRAMIVSAAVGVSLAVGALAAAASASTGERPTASATAATGTVFGGRTSQRWPVVVELSKSGRQIVEISAGIQLNCTSGSTFRVPDRYVSLTVSSGGKFSARFGPMTQRNPDGTTTDFEGSVSGSLNKARTKVSGKWQLKGTDHDATGAVTDTCDSGTISWTAKN